MQKSIVWEGIAKDTEQYCSVTFPNNGITVRSQIDGRADGKPVYVEYALHLDTQWQAIPTEIDFHVNNNQHSQHFRRDDNGA